MPPMPPASFGPLPEPLPLPKSEPQESLDKASETQVDQVVALYVPKRRNRSTGDQPEPTTRDSRKRETRAPGRAGEARSLPPRPSIGGGAGSNKGEGTFSRAVGGAPSKEQVAAAWDRYCGARKGYEVNVRSAYERAVVRRRGDLLSAHGKLQLHEWELTGNGLAMSTPGIHAKMARGPKETPVVLVVQAADGQTRRLPFAEHHRAGVKALAAEIRKRGKRATPEGRVQATEAARKKLQSDCERGRASFIDAAKKYAALTSQRYFGRSVESAVSQFPSSVSSLERDLMGPKLRRPLSEFEQKWGELTTETKLLIVGAVILLIVILAQIT